MLAAHQSMHHPYEGINLPTTSTDDDCSGKRRTEYFLLGVDNYFNYRDGS